VKTGKPAVRRITIHKTSATGVDHSETSISFTAGVRDGKDLPVQLLCQGKEDRGSFCFFMARTSLKWLVKIVIQEIKTPHATRSTSHQKIVRAPFDRLINARNMKAVFNRTHMYGTPQEVVLRKIFGAWSFKANP